MKRLFTYCAMTKLLICSLFAQNGLCINVDYLYWKAEQFGMSYALGVTDFSNNPNFIDFSQKFSWASGFKIGAEYIFCNEAYDLSLEWTRYHNKFSSTDSAPIVQATSLIGFASGLPVGTESTSEWQLNFDMVDLDLSSPLLKFCSFSLQPLIGIKGGCINQTQTGIYNDFIDGMGNTIDGYVKNVNQFWGVGPKIGFNLDYVLSKRFDVISVCSGALLCGHARSPTTVFVSQPLETPPIVDQQVFYEQGQIVPTVQIFLGINYFVGCYKNFFCNARAGYEVQYYWHTWRNQGSTFEEFYIPDLGYGDLMFQGLTARLEIGF